MARITLADQRRLSQRLPEHDGCNNCNGSGWRYGYTPKDLIGNAPLIQCTGPRPLSVAEKIEALAKRVEELEKREAEREKR